MPNCLFRSQVLEFLQSIKSRCSIEISLALNRPSNLSYFQAIKSPVSDNMFFSKFIITTVGAVFTLAGAATAFNGDGTSLKTYPR